MISKTYIPLVVREVVAESSNTSRVEELNKKFEAGVSFSGIFQAKYVAKNAGKKKSKKKSAGAGRGVGVGGEEEDEKKESV